MKKVDVEYNNIVFRVFLVILGFFFGLFVCGSLSALLS